MLARRLLPAFAALALLAPARAAEADRYLPAETQQVAVVNVKQLLDSPLVKKFALPEVEKQLKDNKEYKQFQDFTGIDILKDVTSVVVGNVSTRGDNFVIIVRGKFDTDKIHKSAQQYAEIAGASGQLVVAATGHPVEPVGSRVVGRQDEGRGLSDHDGTVCRWARSPRRVSFRSAQSQSRMDRRKIPARSFSVTGLGLVASSRCCLSAPSTRASTSVSS